MTVQKRRKFRGEEFSEEPRIEQDAQGTAASIKPRPVKVQRTDAK